MALVDFVIVGLSIGFAVICWINSRDGDAITSTSSSSSVSKMKLPGIDDISIMDKIAKESAPAVASAVVTQYEPIEEEELQEEEPSNEIPEFDDMEEENTKMAKIECPNCSSIIEIEEKGTMQNLTCDSCGFSGELEV